jgi:hypothetical protein
VVDLHGSAHLPDSPDIDLGTSTGRTPAAFVDALTSHNRLRVNTTHLEWIHDGRWTDLLDAAATVDDDRRTDDAHKGITVRRTLCA